MYLYAHILTVMKIYTKSGDSGKTSLFGGTRLRKDHIRIEAYGTVDETNAAIGVLLSHLDQKYDELEEIQSELFDIGAHLASDGRKDQKLPKLDKKSIQTLEEAIDQMTESLKPLRAFILPGGSSAGAAAHLARTICRRAERRVVSLAEVEDVDPFIIKYLNRLSDYLFTLSRKINQNAQIEETKWKPKS